MENSTAGTIAQCQRTYVLEHNAYRLPNVMLLYMAYIIKKKKKFQSWNTQLRVQLSSCEGVMFFWEFYFEFRNYL